MALDKNFVLNRIEELCKKKNYSYYKLAQKAGIHQCTISILINRKSTPNVYSLSKICDALDITLAQFFAPDDEKVQLSEKQKEILTNFGELNDAEWELVKAYMKGLVDAKKLKSNKK